jgi:hypothetical protein
MVDSNTSHNQFGDLLCRKDCNSDISRVQRKAAFLYCPKYNCVCEEVAKELFKDGRYFVWPDGARKKKEMDPKIQGTVWWWPLDK